MAAEPVRPPAALADDARRLLADLDAGARSTTRPRTPRRRRWLRAQVLGLRTTAERLAGEPIALRRRGRGVLRRAPRRRSTRRCSRPPTAPSTRCCPGPGPLRRALHRLAGGAGRRRSTSCAPAIDSLAEDFRERTDRLFGLPEGEHIDFDLVTDEPWSGFNYYLGDLRSRVVDQHRPAGAVATSLGPPRRPRGLSRATTPSTAARRSAWSAASSRLEETIFLVGTPQCLLAEGLADLGLEVDLRRAARGAWPPSTCARSASPTTPRSRPRVAVAGEALDEVRGNLALLLHDEGVDPDDVVAYAERWGLLPAGPGREGGAVPDRPDVAGLHLLLPRGPAAVPARSSPATRPASSGCITEQLLPADLVPAA